MAIDIKYATTEIKWKLMSPTAKLPVAGRPGDIGFDICCDEDFCISSGETRKVATNLQLADMPTRDGRGNSIFFKIEGRSGLAASGIFPTGGIIDPSYRGEVSVVLNCLNFDRSNYPAKPNTMGGLKTGTIKHFKKGDRIAQLVVYKVATQEEVVMEVAEEITKTVRGSSGFGSSGA